jgi:putative IMPACT (imprinted ancient) family translation regulator
LEFSEKITQEKFHSEEEDGNSIFDGMVFRTDNENEARRIKNQKVSPH